MFSAQQRSLFNFVFLVQEVELEQEKQQQVVLIQELEEQKAKLEQMLLEAQQEREHLKAAVTQEVPVLDQEVTSVSSGLSTEVRCLWSSLNSHFAVDVEFDEQ